MFWINLKNRTFLKKDHTEIKTIPTFHEAKDENSKKDCKVLKKLLAFGENKEEVEENYDTNETNSLVTYSSPPEDVLEKGSENHEKVNEYYNNNDVNLLVTYFTAPEDVLVKKKSVETKQKDKNKDSKENNIVSKKIVTFGENKEEVKNDYNDNETNPSVSYSTPKEDVLVKMRSVGTNQEVKNDDSKKIVEVLKKFDTFGENKKEVEEDYNKNETDLMVTRSTPSEDVFVRRRSRQKGEKKKSSTSTAHEITKRHVVIRNSQILLKLVCGVAVVVIGIAIISSK